MTEKRYAARRTMRIAKLDMIALRRYHNSKQGNMDLIEFYACKAIFSIYFEICDLIDFVVMIATA